ncbi:hypothetical protein Tco_1407068 [Tanacetum coccineum]
MMTSLHGETAVRKEKRKMVINGSSEVSLRIMLDALDTPPFPALLQLTPSNQAEGATEKEGPEVKKQKKDDEDERLISIFKQIHISLSFLEAMIYMPKGAKEASLRVGNGIVTSNIGKSMNSKYSRDDYMYCVDHTAKLIREQWVDTVDHDGKWVEAEEDGDLNKVEAVSFYPRTEQVEPLEWKAPNPQASNHLS